jgi:hypothetical protein
MYHRTAPTVFSRLHTYTHAHMLRVEPSQLHAVQHFHTNESQTTEPCSRQHCKSRGKKPLRNLGLVDLCTFSLSFCLCTATKTHRYPDLLPSVNQHIRNWGALLYLLHQRMGSSQLLVFYTQITGPSQRFQSKYIEYVLLSVHLCLRLR